MQPELLTIGLGALSGITALALIKDSLYIVGPDEIGLRLNRITQTVRPILSSDQKEQRNVIVSTISRVPAVRTSQGDIHLTEETAEFLRKDERARKEFARRFQIEEVKISRVKAREIVIERRQMPVPKRGIGLKLPLVEAVTTVPATRMVADPGERGLQVPVRLGDETLLGQPDIQLSYAIQPTKAHNLVYKFAQQSSSDLTPVEKFRRAVESLAASAVLHTVSNLDYSTDLTGPENLTRVNERARTILAQLLHEREIDEMIEIQDVTFQGIIFPKKTTEGINSIAVQRRQMEVLGIEATVALQQAEILARGEGTVVFLGDRGGGVDTATALLARQVNKEE